MTHNLAGWNSVETAALVDSWSKIYEDEGIRVVYEACLDQAAANMQKIENVFKVHEPTNAGEVQINRVVDKYVGGVAAAKVSKLHLIPFEDVIHPVVGARLALGKVDLGAGRILAHSDVTVCNYGRSGKDEELGGFSKEHLTILLGHAETLRERNLIVRKVS